VETQLDAIKSHDDKKQINRLLIASQAFYQTGSERDKRTPRIAGYTKYQIGPMFLFLAATYTDY
jgi:hypothetical protein